MRWQPMNVTFNWGTASLQSAPTMQHPESVNVVVFFQDAGGFGGFASYSFTDPKAAQFFIDQRQQDYIVPEPLS